MMRAEGSPFPRGVGGRSLLPAMPGECSSAPLLCVCSSTRAANEELDRVFGGEDGESPIRFGRKESPDGSDR